MLEHRPEFQTFLRWLRESLADTDNSLREIPAYPEIKQAQGKAQTLLAILNTIPQARDLYNKLNKPR